MLAPALFKAKVGPNLQRDFYFIIINELIRLPGQPSRATQNFMIQNCAILYFLWFKNVKYCSQPIPLIRSTEEKAAGATAPSKTGGWTGRAPEAQRLKRAGRKRGVRGTRFNWFCRSLPGPVTVDHAARRSARSCRKEWPNAAAKTGGACRTGCAKPCAPGPGIPGPGVGEEQEAGRSWGHPGSDQPPAGAAGGVQAGRKFSSPRPPGNRATRSPAGRIRREAGPGPGCRPGHRCASVCRR